MTQTGKTKSAGYPIINLEMLLFYLKNNKIEDRVQLSYHGVQISVFTVRVRVPQCRL